MKILISLSLLSLLFFACSNEPSNVPQLSIKEIQDKLLEANIKVAQLESEQIDAYVLKQKLDVIRSGTGLRYEVYKNGEGEKIIDGNTVLINYKVFLLNGKECYSTQGDPEELIVGKSNAESGLHEAMIYLKKGDKATIIIPSHLAHGLTGDLKEIPLRSTIVYDIEILDIK